jgi:hypothetical protein
MANGNLLRAPEGELFKHANGALSTGFYPWLFSHAPRGIVGVPYSLKPAMTNEYVWGNTPYWVPWNGGVLSGTPPEVGTWQVNATAWIGSHDYHRSFEIVIGYDDGSVTHGLAAGEVGKAYSQSISTLDPGGAVAWTLWSGALPPGLTLNNGATPVNKQVLGTPTTPGTYDWLMRVTNQNGEVLSASSYRITVEPAREDPLTSVQIHVWVECYRWIGSNLYRGDVDVDLCVIDPLGYKYGRSRQYASGPVYAPGVVSPSGGRASPFVYSMDYRAAPYMADEYVGWASAPPAGVYTFWCVVENFAMYTNPAFRMQVVVNGSVVWESSGAYFYRPSLGMLSYIWHFDTATMRVY